MNVVEKIKELKKKHNAVILAHTYQRPEIQDLADFVGDSLELSLKVKDSDADKVVFCGVRFMAETAKIISPEKTVLLPELSAGCPMADMINAKQLIELKAKYPNYVVVCYVNSTADVKAESDICCTSSSALKIVSSIPQNKGVIFVPDVNLGSFVKNSLKRENMVLWPGHCSVHSNIEPEEVLELKAKYKGATVLAHPECRPEVVALADFTLSTSAMVRKVAELNTDDIIVLTEKGIAHPLKKQYPNKNFHFIERAVCVNMKKTTIESLLDSLELMQNEIKLEESLIARARRSVDAMLDLA